MKKMVWLSTKEYKFIISEFQNNETETEKTSEKNLFNIWVYYLSQISICSSFKQQILRQWRPQLNCPYSIIWCRYGDLEDLYWTSVTPNMPLWYVMIKRCVSLLNYYLSITAFWEKHEKFNETFPSNERSCSRNKVSFVLLYVHCPKVNLIVKSIS